MVRGAKLRIHGTVFAAGRGTEGNTAKGCLEVAKRRKEKTKRERYEEARGEKSLFMRLTRAWSLEFQRGNHGRLGGYVY